ncbi:MAG: VWA domain-containing protein [Saprospiraceae bacterium]|nr:VWA domain-containing protein [Saprospiraceae bacterium]
MVERFAHPEHLWLLVTIPILVVISVWWLRYHARARAAFGDSPTFLPPVSKGKFFLKQSLVITGIALLAIAWADPQFGAKTETAQLESSDVFIALDISQSMLCRDVSPSRLELAKIFSQKLLKQLEGERVGLIFFAGNAFLQMPLSADYAFVLQSIQSATPDMVSEQGTNIAAAIEIAQKSFDPEPGGGRMIVLITDGEEHDEAAQEQAESAFENGTVVYAVGAGTTAGGPIPNSENSEGQFKRDEQNNLVRTKMNEIALSKIALAGGGGVLNVSQGDAAIQKLKHEVAGLGKRTVSIKSFSSYESWYQWFLLPALVLFFLELFISFKGRVK